MMEHVVIEKKHIEKKGIPAVDIIKNAVRLSTAMDRYQVLLDPGDQVILERALDELMKNVWGNKMMDVGTREIIRKRLYLGYKFTDRLWNEKIYHNVTYETIFIPKNS
jgi:hypothetical protein